MVNKTLATRTDHFMLRVVSIQDSVPISNPSLSTKDSLTIDISSENESPHIKYTNTREPQHHKQELGPLSRDQSKRLVMNKITSSKNVLLKPIVPIN